MTAAAPSIARTAPTSSRGWAAVLSVAVASFNLVTNEFLPVGLLPQIHRGLSVSDGVAGTMVTAPGVVAALSALLAPVALRRVDRRIAMLMLSLTFVLADVVAALAPDFAVMLGARALLGIGIGGFWASAVGLGPRLVAEQHGQRATSLIFSGISLGTVVGVPAGPLLGHAVGWRGTFLVIAALGLVPFALQALTLPRLPVSDAVSLRSFGTLLKVPAARHVLGVTALAVGAQFAAYTFITPFLGTHTRAGDAEIGTLLLVFAAAGVVGNFVTAAVLARIPRLTRFGVLALMLAPQWLFPLVARTPAAAGLLAVWGFAYGGVPVALQTWLFHSTPSAATENGSGMFVATFQTAIALGSLLGGGIVDVAGASAAMLAGGVLSSGALGLAVASERPRVSRRWRRGWSIGPPPA